MSGPNPIQRTALLLESRAEAIYFDLLKWSALPVRLAYLRAQPTPITLGYADLLAACTNYTASGKPGISQTKRDELKWARRVARLARAYGAHRILEVGCGYGYAAAWLSASGFSVQAIDLSAKILDAGVGSVAVSLTNADAANMPFASGCFDLIFSVNSFEHFSDPESVLEEILRVARPGAILYFSFAPLYYSPFGLHAVRRIGAPYPQLLFAESDIQRYVDDNRATLAATYDDVSDKSTIGPFVNRWASRRFLAMFARHSADLQILSLIQRTSLAGLRTILEHAPIIKAHSSAFDDLIVEGMKLIAIRK
jgi:SAM-dependent methyltransferase